ncbi:hypothetical protein [Fodinicola acaciae]|uniref:hypothetical protein n=1 Tax=Fodinicola acaciae TaxID=2681555 RepID=UPI0013D3A154|nr:hypothetical protein [Fodinicola acaciae]
MLEAAEELTATRPSPYKVEVPLSGTGPAERIAAWCAHIHRATPVPWVVLSQGVQMADFPAAAGFLAGRAVWRDCVAPVDPTPALTELARPRLAALRETVINTPHSSLGDC